MVQKLFKCFAFIFPKIRTNRSFSSVKSIQQHKFSVAPMMEYTDRYQRTLQRLLSNDTVLYTEMIGATTITRSNSFMKYLEADFSREEPMVLQIGGNDPQTMKEASKIVANFGYQEINLNVGCPSQKVAGAGCFGAALMLKPELVVQLASSIFESTGRPATIKCRIGVNDIDSYEHLYNFIRKVSEEAGVTHFIIHARKAILNKKFTPDDNRKIPPLNYNVVYSLVQDFPHLYFTLNGGIKSYEEIETHFLLSNNQHVFNTNTLQTNPPPLTPTPPPFTTTPIPTTPTSTTPTASSTCTGLLGVMVGRAAIENPFYWRHVDSRIYKKSDPGRSRREIINLYAEFANQIEAQTLISLTSHQQQHQQQQHYPSTTSFTSKQESALSSTRRDVLKPLWNFFSHVKNGKLFRSYLDAGLIAFREREKGFLISKLSSDERNQMNNNNNNWEMSLKKVKLNQSNKNDESDDDDDDDGDDSDDDDRLSMNSTMRSTTMNRNETDGSSSVSSSPSLLSSPSLSSHQPPEDLLKDQWRDWIRNKDSLSSSISSSSSTTSSITIGDILHQAILFSEIPEEILNQR